jgi:thymidylate synthase (FAD)
MSTRYCDFSKDKFDRELSFCKPVWWNENNLNQNCTDKWSKEDWFMYSCKASETAYLNMRELGATPEEAREVLLLDTITEAYYTAFEDDWKTIVSMRTAPTAHPNMVAILNKIKHLYQ